MSEKFKDFPCFYYLDNRVNRKSRIQFYSMLASMFGQTPEQAAQNSELFAHASGKLFGGTGYTLDEIKKEAGNYFEKPYKDCRGFYRRKAYDEAGLKDSCCVVCPYSYNYLNNCVEQERQILRILTTNRDMLDLVNCSSADFKSKLAISCSNDLSELPVIPFNAYLFEYLVREGDVDTTKLSLFIRDALADCNIHVPDDTLSSFITMQLTIISRIKLPGGDSLSALLYALNTLREAKYVPPLLVHAVSIGDRGKTKTPSKIQGDLSRLYDDVPTNFITTEPAAKNKQDFSVLARKDFNSSDSDTLFSPTEDFSALALTPSDIIDGMPMAQEPKNTEPKIDFSALALDTHAVSDTSLKTEDSSVGVSTKEDIQNSDSCHISNGDDDLVPPTSENDAYMEEGVAFSEEEVSLHYEEAPDMFSFEGEFEASCDNAPEIPEVYDSENSNTENVVTEETVREEKDTEDVPVVKIVSVPEQCAATDESISENETPSDNYNPCCICHGTEPDKYVFTADWVRSLYRHCVVCENALSKGAEKPFLSSALSHPPVATGCSFSHDKLNADCIYSDIPVTLSDDFTSIINDCSDYACDLSKLVAFIEACDNASSLSIECVYMYGVEGLLFYVSGAYYFIGGGTTACAALKQILSDTKKTALYSINPILVHEKLLHLGLRRVKIESLAVMYSVFVGTDLLLPPSIMFVVDNNVDTYRSIMPQYEMLYNRILLTAEEVKRYDKLQRLEWALASSVDTSYIALGHNRSVYGSNALNYRFALLDVGRICREGVLYVVTLDNDSAIPSEEAKLFWEDVAGRLASSSLSCMNYSFIVGLGNGISYFTCFEEEAFFDSLMASARSAYKKLYKKEVHLQVVQEKYITN